MQCIAKRRDGERCRTPSVKGATVCRMHGANSAVRLRGRQRIIEAQALNVLSKNRVVPVTDPLTELARLAGEVVALKDLLAERVSELREAGAIEVALYERALDRTWHGSTSTNDLCGCRKRKPRSWSEPCSECCVRTSACHTNRLRRAAQPSPGDFARRDPWLVAVNEVQVVARGIATLDRRI
jgi:hypothetical protein